MAKEWAKKFYKSKAWQECRASYIVTVNGLCERCLALNEYRNGYIVHHKIVLTPDNIGDPYVALNHEHLEYCCLDCHNEEHEVAASVAACRVGFKFNSAGQMIKVDS